VTSRADLLLANAQSAPAAIEGFAGPSVYFIHDELSLGVYRSYERRLAKRIRFAGRYALDWPFFRAYCVRNRRAMRRAKLVVANSRYVAAMAKTRLGIEAAVVYPQVDVEALSRVVLPPVAERRAIMMVGDQEVKGTSTMRAIARAMPEEQFLMVGRSYTERRDGNVTFRGFVENPVSHYRQAKLVLMPSTWEEGFGMVSVEAAALGIPTLVSDRGGLPETVPSRDSVVSEYRSAPRWVEKIRAVLADYDRFSRAAREHAKGLDGRAQAEKLVEEIRRATGIDLSRSGR
jgi:glycosyltransferase involved in cell wall biosynthesis